MLPDLKASPRRCRIMILNHVILNFQIIIIDVYYTRTTIIIILLEFQHLY